MSILDTFYILFDSDTSKLDKGVEASEKKAGSLLDKLKGVDKEAGNVGDRFLQLANKGAGLIGVGLSLGAIVAGIKATAATYTELDKLAQQFRTTASAVDEFIDAGELLGLSEETTKGGLKSLETAIQDTHLGLGRAKKVFEELGIAVEGANGKIKPTTQVMAELAGKFKDMERGTQIRVMERLGLDPALLKLFNSDMAALQKRMEDIDRAAGFDFDKAVKRANAYTKANKELGVEIKTLQMFIGKMLESMNVAVLPLFTEGIKKVTEILRTVVGFLMDHSRVVEGFFIAAGAAILYFLVPAAISGAVALWAMIAPFVLIGLAVVAVGAAFALLYDDIMTFVDGGDSLIGTLLGKLQELGEYIGGAIFETVQTLKQAFVDLGTAAGEVWDMIASKLEWLTALLKPVIDMIKTVAGAAGGVVGALFSAGSAVSGVGAAQGALAQASSPLAAQTSNSITNASRGGNSSTVTVGQVNVQTQATDAAGISKSIGGALGSQMRQASSNFDDGVAI